MTAAERTALQVRVQQTLAAARGRRTVAMPAKQAAAAASGDTRPVVTQAHVEAAFATTRPSVSAAERARYDRIHAEFSQGRASETEPAAATLRPGQRITLA